MRRTFVLPDRDSGRRPAPAAQTRATKTLDIYVVDVEGGNATLFVSPSGESLLIDTGNGGAAAARDAERIMAAVKDAGLRQIDHLVTTHYHGDHFGAMTELAARIPIQHFIDHGPNVQPNAATDAFLQKDYPALYAEGEAHRRQARATASPLAGVDVRVVASAGQVLQTPLPGGGQPNPYCAALQAAGSGSRPRTRSRSGRIITFGRFRTVHLGDLTWNKEFDLMCPTNRLGTVDLFIVSHHGQPVSNAPVLVHAHAAARGHHEQRHAQGRAARRDEGAALVAGPRGSVADALLAAERPGVHRARACSSPTSSTSSRPAMPIAAMTPPRAGPGRAAAAGAQRRGLLDQGLRAGGRVVHGHQRPERLLEAVRDARGNVDAVSDRISRLRSPAQGLRASMNRAEM